MAGTHARSLTLTSKGQVTISARARKLLKLDRGDTLVEVVVGDCLVLMPENQILAETARRAQNAIKKAGVTVDDIKTEADRLRGRRLAKRYPGL